MFVSCFKPRPHGVWEKLMETIMEKLTNPKRIHGFEHGKLFLAKVTCSAQNEVKKPWRWEQKMGDRIKKIK